MISPKQMIGIAHNVESRTLPKEQNVLRVVDPRESVDRKERGIISLENHLLCELTNMERVAEERMNEC